MRYNLWITLKMISYSPCFSLDGYYERPTLLVLAQGDNMKD